MSAIKKFEAFEILDSLGYPTLRGRLFLENGAVVEVDMPSPVWEYKSEPVALRDGGKRFLGYGMKKASKIISEGVTAKLKGVSVFKQKEIDLWLNKADNTEKKEFLGVSTLLLVSVLVAKAAAKVQGIPFFKYINQLYNTFFSEKLKLETLPTPIVTLINGGKHVNNPLDFKEFYFVPSSSFSFEKSLEAAVETYHQLKLMLEYKNISTSIADQGGFSPNIYSNLDAVELITESLLKLDIKPGLDAFLGVDVGSDDFYENSGYSISNNPQAQSPDEFYKYISSLVKNYNVLYIEDAFASKDSKNWKRFYQDHGDYYYIALDHVDIFGKEGLKKLLENKIGNTVVLKLLRYPTLLNLLTDVNFCRKNNLTYVVSQEVSETNQGFISDISVGIQAPFVKFGAPVRGERVAKYNRLLEISRHFIKKESKISKSKVDDKQN